MWYGVVWGCGVCHNASPRRRFDAYADADAYVGVGAGQGVVLVVGAMGRLSWCEQGQPKRLSLSDVVSKDQPYRLSLAW